MSHTGASLVAFDTMGFFLFFFFNVPRVDKSAPGSSVLLLLTAVFILLGWGFPSLPFSTSPAIFYAVPLVFVMQELVIQPSALQEELFHIFYVPMEVSSGYSDITAFGS